VFLEGPTRRIQPEVVGNFIPRLSCRVKAAVYNPEAAEQNTGEQGPCLGPGEDLEIAAHARWTPVVNWNRAKEGAGFVRHSRVNAETECAE